MARTEPDRYTRTADNPAKARNGTTAATESICSRWPGSSTNHTPATMKPARRASGGETLTDRSSRASTAGMARR